MEGLPPDIVAAHHAVEKAAQELKAELDALLKEPIQSAAPLHQAQMQVAFMNSALSIGQLLQALHGSTGNESFQAEQVSTNAYLSKVQKAVAAEDLKQQRKTTEINIDAAHRFITHAIPELTAEQQASLKEVASKQQSRLNEPPLLAAHRKPVHRKVSAEKGASAVERLQKHQVLDGSARRPKRDAAMAFLDEIDPTSVTE